MPPSLLSELSEDVLRSVVSLLGSISVGRLWLCGCLALRAKFEHARVVDALKIELETPTPKWPSIVYHFQYLEHLSVKCAINGLYTPIPDISVEDLPKGLRTIHFHFANDFCCFFERDLDACDVDRYNADGIRLKDMSELLPCLEKLKFVGTVVHLPLQDTFLSSLPQTLVCLHLPLNYSISAAMLSDLPRTLQKLECSLRRYGQVFDPDEIVFPPLLVSLTLYQLRSMTILPLLPHSLRKLCFLDIDEDAYVGLDPFYEFLPPALTTLHSYVNHFNATFTKALPRSLTELGVEFEEFELAAVKHFPPQLRIWQTSFHFSSLDTLLWTWDLLPPTMERVPKLLITPETLPDAETWNLLPRAIQWLSLDLEEPEWNENSLRLLPPAITELHIHDSTQKMDHFDWTPKFALHLTSLAITGHICSQDISTQLQKLENLTQLAFTTNRREIAPYLYLHLPPALTSLDTDVGCDNSFESMPMRWPLHMKSLKLSNLGRVNPTSFYSCLPRTLTKLSIIDTFLCLPFNFAFLPRRLLHCSIMRLDSQLNDEALFALPQSLRSLRFLSSDQSIFTIQGLMGLPYTLEVIKVPKADGTVRDSEMLPFLQSRPCILFRIGTVSPSCSEEVQKAYERKHLTLGNVKSMYDYRWR